MAPTAAMLLLSHNGKTHAPSVTMPPSSPSSTTYFGLKGSALKWVAKYNPVPKAGSDKNQIRCVVDSPAVDKRFEDAFQLCSC
ncbi:hypothetical protein SESBI_27122 [Sesbania bispinosa]|nr:hypothetical protein SESBI_27122 [Sesbania bispinosa]